MKKILHIQLMPILSGAQKVCLDEIENLGKNYEQWLLCSGVGPFTKKASEFGVKHIVVDNLKREISIRDDLLALFKIYQDIKNKKFDIVHTHSSKTGFLGRVAARCAGVKTIVHTVHGFAFPSTENILLKIIYYVMEVIAALCTDALIVMNKSDYELAKKYLPISNNKIYLLNNGVKLEKFKCKGDNYTNNDTIKIVMVGRLCEQKNPLLLLNAFCSLQDNYQLYYIGDGPLRTEIEKEILNKKLNERVKILGWVDNVPEVLPSFDIFVLPSRWEGMPLAMLEAMASGLPVISSDIPSNRFLIENTNGELFKSEDAISLKEKIEYLGRDPKKRALISQDAYKKIKANFSLDARICSLRRIYEEQ